MEVSYVVENFGKEIIITGYDEVYSLLLMKMCITVSLSQIETQFRRIKMSQID